MEGQFTIGPLAEASGVKVQTVRYYEQIGLMPAPHRSEGNQRLYSQPHVDRLAFIRHARDLGFSLNDVRELLELQDKPDLSCGEADQIASQHLNEIERKIMRLQALKTELARMVDQCAGGVISNCRVIEILSNHDKCVTDHKL
ncbi:MAG: MerR family transcriptional regulator [Alphaproteobacteria bacterium]|nr:MAG: MerR family transcriptional regulator [Alphaproteobacteria bacterium]